ncbi:ParB N-terminal domain-containing protein [Actinomadura graeca]|uniref:ParB N-terminal domain-containing protein n=1 Tax=Actinomadura graeca TaxID=2750812 RepID=A0ABX8QRV5_9ACTN|nr:ParB N-terminal domain-containing protein [Actinomadura graeca]QXJ21467.1 ParB N-terminal domain-containing protein [Actinomadura graeca]
MVPVDVLERADSPRLEGENTEHIRALADMDSALPPILVHRRTMRVVDGMHRLRAAVLKGQREIRVRYIDGADSDVFVAAVRANIGHGLPLSLSDREAAAARILTTHPQWSDRAIAEAAGLASTTVARIRSRTTDKDSQPDMRIGKDGRVRPINGAAGRRLAGRLFAERPGASLREIAEMAGISPATAKDVRERLRRGDDPVPAKLTLAERKSEAAARGDGREPPVVSTLRKGRMPDADQILRKLLRDPSLRLNDNGRLLLRWLSARSVNTQEWEGIEDEIPAHCVPLVADLALGIAYEWERFAEVLKRRARAEMA